MSSEVKHDKKSYKFFLKDGMSEAAINYQMIDDNTMDLRHTFVPEESRGKGLAEGLAEAALKYASENSLKVIASCRFVSAYLKRHPEYKNLEVNS